MAEYNDEQGTSEAIDDDLSNFDIDAYRPTKKQLLVAKAANITELNNAEAKIHYFGGADETDVWALTEDLSKHSRRVNKGDLSLAEAMLMAQASTLDAIFTKLAAKAATNMGVHLSAADTYLRLALRAQSQCQTTLRTLGELKNPKQLAFIKQANVAHGHQQVNNGIASEKSNSRSNTSPRTGETQMPPNELTEGLDNDLDFEETPTPIRADQELETLGAIDRANHG